MENSNLLFNEDEFDIIGEETVIISEYFRDSYKCAKAVANDIKSNTSNSLSNFFIEIPKDKYNEVMKILEDKPSTFEGMRKNIRRGELTFVQAKRIVKLGKIKDPNVEYHKLSQSVRLIDSYGLSSVILFGLIQWGHDIEKEKEKDLGLDDVDYHILKSSKITNSSLEFDFDWSSPSFSAVKLSYKGVLDIAKCLMGNTSKRQMIKNIVAKFGGIGGGLVGSYAGSVIGAYLGSLALPIPVMGTSVGAVIGASVVPYISATGGALAGTAGGTFLGNKGLKKALNVVIEDDVDRMFMLLAKVVHEMSIEFMMTPKEVEQLAERIRNFENINLKEKLLKMRKEIDLLAQRKKYLRRNIVKPHLKEILNQARDNVYVPRFASKKGKEEEEEEGEAFKGVKIHPLTISLLFSEEEDVPKDIERMIEMEDFELLEEEEKEKEKKKGEEKEKESLSPVSDKYDMKEEFDVM